MAFNSDFQLVEWPNKEMRQRFALRDQFEPWFNLPLRSRSFGVSQCKMKKSGMDRQSKLKVYE